MTTRLLTKTENELVLAALRDELARRRISRQRLADEARISLSTLEKALSGSRPFTHTTVVRIESALGLILRPRAEARSATDESAAAPANLGAYTRAGVKWLEGDYIALRPSFSDPRAVYTYRIRIYWEVSASRLLFQESGRVDAAYAQAGEVSVPHQSGHIYLVTNDQGQFRLMTLSRPTISRTMYGVLSTLQAGKGAQLTPLVTPIALVPVGSVARVELGKIESGHAVYGQYRKLLEKAVEDGFALFVGG